MKAIRYHGPKDLRLEELVEPEVLPRSVRVAVEWCGICGSDLAEYLNGPTVIPSSKPHPLTGEVAPIVLGHEFSGRVVELGDGVHGLELGDLVAIEPLLRDNECPSCMAGEPQLCRSLGFHGLSGGGGGFAERTVVPAYMVHRVPDGVTPVQAALAEPLAVAMHAIGRSGLKEARRVLVVGAGPIGLCVSLCLQSLGIREIVVSEPAPARRRLAETLGLEAVLDPRSTSVREAVRDLGGASVAFDTAGRGDSLETALNSVSPGGTVVNVTPHWSTAGLRLHRLTLREIVLTGSLAYRPREYASVLQLLSAGQLNSPERIVTQTADLQDTIREGFEALAEGRVAGKFLARCGAVGSRDKKAG